MKTVPVLFMAFTLLLAGCSSLSSVQKEGKSIPEYLVVLKKKGCSAVPEPALQLLVLWIKSRVPNYPKNGICNPTWVNDVLQQVIDKWERDNDIQNGSTPLGYQAYRGHRFLDKPNRIALLHATSPTRSCSTRWIQNGSCNNPQDRTFVHASIIEAHSRCSSDTRFHLHPFMRSIQQT
jgi:hypothetical protein